MPSEELFEKTEVISPDGVGREKDLLDPTDTKILHPSLSSTGILPIGTATSLEFGRPVVLSTCISSFCDIQALRLVLFVGMTAHPLPPSISLTVENCDRLVHYPSLFPLPGGDSSFLVKFYHFVLPEDIPLNPGLVKVSVLLKNCESWKGSILRKADILLTVGKRRQQKKVDSHAFWEIPISLFSRSCHFLYQKLFPSDHVVMSRSS